MKSYTLQALSGLGVWYDVHIDPHHETIAACRERREKGRLRNPDSVYRIVEREQRVIETDEGYET